MAITTVLHLGTKNDTNGNPRRLWVGIDESGHTVRIEDEGYAGRPEWVRNLSNRGVWDVWVPTTVSHYNLLRKQAEKFSVDVLTTGTA